MAVAQLVEKLQSANIDGTLYIGYPILATVDETVFIDALLVSDAHGLVVIDASSTDTQGAEGFWDEIEARQDSLYFALANNLGKHKSLRSGRELAVQPAVITLLPTTVEPPAGANVRVADIGTLPDVLADLPKLNRDYGRVLNAALQRVTTIKPQKRRASVQQEGSRGAVLKRLEKSIANLDQWQKKAAIETPDAPQRIRGLAGSGKTVVLAFKAAYLHAQNPDWSIAFTFHTQSLYQQLRELVRRFTYEHANDEPDFEQLRVMHSWGSTRKPGLYAAVAQLADLPMRDFLYAKSKFGFRDAFHGVCLELLNALASEPIKPVWDAVLIDEAQDLPWPFFRLVYLLTKEPKRIIWAYDELQNLGYHQMPDLASLFGQDEAGRELVSLENRAGQPSRDIVLPVCYRNTPWSLTLGHALGFGVYRENGLVQLFDESSLWDDIGYQVTLGSLEPGETVELERKRASYPEYFGELLQDEDAIQWKTFETRDEQAEFIAAEIASNLSRDELEPDDILIILPEPLSAKAEGMRINDALTRRGIESHIVGVTTSRDEMFNPSSVAISGIYRAKGNEAPMVYVANCEDCFEGRELIRLRNTIFTAITRSRAWIRLLGCGEAMDQFSREMDAVRQAHYRLRFPVPTAEQLAHLRMIHRDRSSREKARIQATERSLKELITSLRTGQLVREDLPKELLESLHDVLGKETIDEGSSDQA